MDSAGNGSGHAEALSKRNASKDALKTIYFVVIGLAVTEALSRAFLVNSVFSGGAVFSRDGYPPFILLLGFLATMTRFVHGASLHLDLVQGGRYKTVVDYCVFLVHAAGFYLMALVLRDVIIFAEILTGILVWDSLWLIVLLWAKYIMATKERTTAQRWLASNAVLAPLLAVAVELTAVVGVECVSWFVAGCAMMATVGDYWWNWDFYFPKETSGASDGQVAPRAAVVRNQSTTISGPEPPSPPSLPSP